MNESSVIFGVYNYVFAREMYFPLLLRINLLKPNTHSKSHYFTVFLPKVELFWSILLTLGQFCRTDEFGLFIFKTSSICNNLFGFVDRILIIFYVRPAESALLHLVPYFPYFEVKRKLTFLLMEEEQNLCQSLNFTQTKPFIQPFLCWCVMIRAEEPYL